MTGAGRLIDDRVPRTICDGLRGHLSPRTFAQDDATSEPESPLSRASDWVVAVRRQA